MDDVTHDGRGVALPADAIEESLGFVPPVAYGLHENGSTWTSPITRQGSLLIFHAPRLSSNTVTFTGTVTIDATSAGDGSQYTYSLNSIDSVTDPLVNWTGVLATEWDNETVSAIGSSTSIHDTDSELGAGDTSSSSVPISGTGTIAVVDMSPVADGSQSFSHTGGEQTWSVPTDVETVTAKLSGAGGSKGSNGAAGGTGGYVEGDLSTTPGETLYIYVGGSGGNGGFIEGRLLVLAMVVGRAISARVGNALADRVAVAGGGSGDDCCGGNGGAGGDGGADTPAGGQGGSGNNIDPQGGGGGTQSSGGSGGGTEVLQGAGASSDPLDSIPIVVFAAVIAVFGVGFVTRRFVSEKRSTILGAMGMASLLVIVIAGEAFTPGVILRPIGENFGSVIPALALLFGGLEAYYLYIRFIKGRQPRPIRIVAEQRK